MYNANDILDLKDGEKIKVITLDNDKVNHGTVVGDKVEYDDGTEELRIFVKYGIDYGICKVVADENEYLEKLNKNQIEALKTYSMRIALAEKNGIKEEYNLNCGRLEGALECLYLIGVITSMETISLYQYFLEDEMIAFIMVKENRVMMGLPFLQNG